MTNKNMAETFYNALASKSIPSLGQYLHADIHFIGPMEEMKGKDNYLTAAQSFSGMFKSLNIRAVFSSDNQAVVIYDLEFPGEIECTRSASLMTFDDEVITRIELFYDSHPFFTMTNGDS